MKWTSPASTVAAALLLASCAQIDPEMQKSSDYVTRLQPLLLENSLLAERVLLQATVVYNDEVEPAAMVDAWTDDVVPIAEHLHQQANLVTAPDTYQAQHEQLVKIWGDRAQAYRDVSEALVTGDPERWTTAKETAKSVRISEEEWFEALNTALAPRGMIVDPYP